MPIAYLDVPTGADADTKRTLVKSLYDALHEVWPFPDDHRIFLREWPRDSVSQNGLLGSEPPRPVFMIHAPQGADVDAKRTMFAKINAAVARAYEGLPDFITFVHEHSLELVAVNGGILAEDQQRVEAQREAYS
jgi:hypothetical protein